MRLILAFSISFLLFSCGEKNHNIEKTYHVYGNCEKCKARIEKAALSEGVTKADWSPDSKLLVLVFDSTKTNPDLILKDIANIGHDNDLYPANDYAYQDLPETCHYERMIH